MNKKQQAFALFDQGKASSSPEVEALKLKTQTKYNYFSQWQKDKEGKPSASQRDESIGSVDETKQSEKAIPPKIENGQKPAIDKTKENKAGEDAEVKPEERVSEKPKVKDEAIGGASEAVSLKDKEGKPKIPERKIATTIADDGIKCTVFLSLQTLTLFRIAAATQAQYDEEGELSLGDFIDTCAEDFFKVRGKKLGLISSGGK